MIILMKNFKNPIKRIKNMNNILQIGYFIEFC